MIVKMKRVVLITQEKDTNCFLERIRKLGLLHIEHLTLPKGERLDLLSSQIALL
jgi:vacuolar-type H+-ATPase subunit I/STV1